MNNLNFSIAIICNNPNMQNKAMNIANNIGCKIIEEKDKNNFDYILQITQDLISLIDNNNIKSLPIFIDLGSDKIIYRLKKGGGYNQDILKSVNIKANKKPYILDLTAGMGNDSFLFAAYGAIITAIEKSPIIYTLLEDALDRAKNNINIIDFVTKITLHNIDAIEFLNNLKQKPDIIYYDPMFNIKKQTAKPSKNMQILQEIGHKENNDQLIYNLAINNALERFVVKRHIKSPYLIDKKPDFSFKGKTNRFDIYIPLQ